MSADSDAAQAVSQLPGLTPGEQQYLQTVARGEGFYGLGWGHPSPKTIADSAAFGIDPMAGVGSKNWGAVQGTGSAGSFPHVDYHAAGPPYFGAAYLGTFKKYATDAEAAADVAKILLKPNVKLALAAGDLHAAVYAQHSNGYFEYAPDKYLAAVKKNYDILVKSLGWQALLSAGETIASNPLVSGFLSSDWGDSSSGELSEVLASADNYLKASDGKES